MNLVALRTFLAIVETGSFVSAAERVHVTQSTVTARVNGLESELGQTLFHRRKSGTVLTSAGFKFLRYAQLMDDLWRQARQETSLPAEVDTVLNIGCHFDLWHGLGQKTLARIRERRPGTACSVWAGEQDDIDRWLTSGLVDAALCHKPSVQEDQRLLRMPPDRLVLYSTVARPLMDWDPAYVYVDGGEAFRRRHAEAYPHSQTPTVTFGSAAWALDYLLAQGGSGYLPERLASASVRAGRLHPVPDAPVFARQPYLILAAGKAAEWEWLAD